MGVVSRSRGAGRKDGSREVGEQQGAKDEGAVTW